MTEAEHNGSNSHAMSSVDLSYDLELEALISMFTFEKPCGHTGYCKLIANFKSFRCLPDFQGGTEGGLRILEISNVHETSSDCPL
jgi:hypothetical protein